MQRFLIVGLLYYWIPQSQFECKLYFLLTNSDFTDHDYWYLIQSLTADNNSFISFYANLATVGLQIYFDLKSVVKMKISFSTPVIMTFDVI